MRARTATSVAFLACVLGVVVLSTGPLLRVRTWFSYAGPLDRDGWIIAVRALVGAAGVVVLATRGRWRRVDRTAGLLAAALVAWLAIGSLWSLDAATTIREALLLAATLAAGAAAAAVLTRVAWMWALWCGVHVGLAWSAVAIVLTMPGTQDELGYWAGVFFNRNSLAIVAGAGMLASLLLLVESWRRMRERSWPAAMGVCATAVAACADAVLLLRARSSTAIVALAIALAVAGLAVLARRLAARGVSLTGIAAVGGVAFLATAAVAWFARGALAGLVGRDAGLSGRSEVWRVSWRWFAKDPIGGQGYLSAGTYQRFLEDVYNAQGMVLYSAHSSFMEVLLGAGVLGFALFVTMIGRLYWRAVAGAVGGRTWPAVWPLALLAFVVAEHLTETLLVGGQLTVGVLGSMLVLVARPVGADVDAVAPRPLTTAGDAR